VGTLVTSIADTGSFGDVCLGSFADQILTLNAGTCPLSISSITGSPGFLEPNVTTYPLVVGAGDSAQVSSASSRRHTARRLGRSHRQRRPGDARHRACPRRVSGAHRDPDHRRKR
jgi:hypothetical protein